MSKAPAFQFYVKDWLSDPELQCVSASTKGIWIDALCYMWEAPERGKLTGTREEIEKLLRATNGDFTQFLNDLENHMFCDILTDANKKITLINRRMYREQKSKENNRIRQLRFQEKHKSNINITPPSSSSSPLYSKKSILDEDFLTSLKEKFTWIDFDKEMVKIDAWLSVNPTRKKTRRFIVGWLSRIDKPINFKKDDPYKNYEYVKGE